MQGKKDTMDEQIDKQVNNYSYHTTERGRGDDEGKYKSWQFDDGLRQCEGTV